MADLKAMRARVLDADEVGIGYIEMHNDTYSALLDCAEALRVIEFWAEGDSKHPNVIAREALAKLKNAP